MLKWLGTFFLGGTPHGHDGINLRRWFVGFVLYLTLLVGAALLCLRWWESGQDPWAQRLWLLALYLFYMSMCCTFFPAPTTWLVLLMAAPMTGLIAPDAFEGGMGLSTQTRCLLAQLATIVIVAAVGAAGTAMANLNEYHLFTFFLRYGKLQKVRQTAFYEKAIRWFSTGPFLLLTAMSFIPLPVDVIRWLAITHRYRRDHYALAYFLGRLIRYGLLATTATLMQLGWQGIAAIQGGLIVMIGIRFVWRWRRKKNGDNIGSGGLISKGPTNAELV